jgi:hypothetical protein
MPELRLVQFSEGYGRGREDTKTTREAIVDTRNKNMP